MACIVNTLSGEVVLLRSLHILGRDPIAANTIHSDPDVSKLHATISWKQGQWFLEDHSTNGTLLDKAHLHRTSRPILKDQIFQLGENESTKWRIQDLEPPYSYIRNLKQETIISLSDAHILPSEDNPEVMLYCRNDKQWLMESGGQRSPLTDRNIISIAGEDWEFINNETLEDTLDSKTSLKDSVIIFDLSNDEEHINLNIQTRTGHTRKLGRRSFNHILLALARKRIERIKESSAGRFDVDEDWVYVDHLLTDVSKELGQEVDVLYLNLQIFRMRQHLYKHAVMDEIIHRPHPGKLRLEFQYFRIMKGDLCIAEVLPK